MNPLHNNMPPTYQDYSNIPFIPLNLSKAPKNALSIDLENPFVIFDLSQDEIGTLLKNPGDWLICHHTGEGKLIYCKAEDGRIGNVQYSPTFVTQLGLKPDQQKGKNDLSVFVNPKRVYKEPEAAASNGAGATVAEAAGAGATDPGTQMIKV